MKKQIRQYKKDLKALAKEIRAKKNTRKEHDNGYVPGLWRDQKDFRFKHIAYCLMRGRKYEEVERYTEKPLYKHEWREIKKLMEVPNENACLSEEGPTLVA